MRKCLRTSTKFFKEVINSKIETSHSDNIADYINSNKTILKDISKIFGSNTKLDKISYESGLGAFGPVGLIDMGDFVFLGLEGKTKGNYPVYFILYISEYSPNNEKLENFELRAYVPEQGNTFNAKQRRPFSITNLGSRIDTMCNEKELLLDIKNHFYYSDNQNKEPITAKSASGRSFVEKDYSGKITNVTCIDCCMGEETKKDIWIEGFTEVGEIAISLKTGKIRFMEFDEDELQNVEIVYSPYDSTEYNTRKPNDLKLLQHVLNEYEIDQATFNCEAGEDEIITPYIEINGKEAKSPSNNEIEFFMAIATGKLSI